MQGYLPAGRAGSVPHFRTRSRIPQWVPGAGHGDAEETNRILVSTSVVDVGESYALTEVRTPSSGGEDGGAGGGGITKGFLEEVPLSPQIPVPGTERCHPTAVDIWEGPSSIAPALILGPSESRVAQGCAGAAGALVVPYDNFQAQRDVTEGGVKNNPPPQGCLQTIP